MIGVPARCATHRSRSSLLAMTDATESAQPDTVSAEGDGISTVEVDGTTILAPTDLAWSVDAGDDDAPPRRWGYRLRWVLAIALLCTALAAVGVLSGVFYHKKHPTPPAAPTTSVPPSPSPPVVPGSAVPEQDRDATYIRLLDKSGAYDHRDHYYTSPESAIGFGRQVCAAIRESVPRTLPEAALARLHPDLTAQQRVMIVDLAVSVYCPELIGR